MAELVRPVWHEMPTGNMKTMGQRLADLQDGTAPAFLVRAHQIRHRRDPSDRHAEVLGRVLHLLHAKHPDEEFYAINYAFDGLGQDPQGFLHHDLTVSASNKPLEDRPMPYFHTTLSGGGLVLAAALGEKPEEALKYGYDDQQPVPEDHPDHPHGQLLRGMVDPDIVSPDIYSCSVGPGDTIIFADHGIRAPWHRFDTDPQLGTRVIQASPLNYGPRRTTLNMV